MKKYKTIIKVSNPKGAVMVNDEYYPVGTLRRYERGHVDGSVMLVTNDIQEIRETYQRMKKVPNMVLKPIHYEWNGKSYEMV